jgi:hypothetical protein
MIIFSTAKPQERKCGLPRVKLTKLIARFRATDGRAHFLADSCRLEVKFGAIFK